MQSYTELPLPQNGSRVKCTVDTARSFVEFTTLIHNCVYMFDERPYKCPEHTLHTKGFVVVLGKGDSTIYSLWWPFSEPRSKVHRHWVVPSTSFIVITGDKIWICISFWRAVQWRLARIMISIPCLIGTVWAMCFSKSFGVHCFPTLCLFFSSLVDSSWFSAICVHVCGIAQGLITESKEGLFELPQPSPSPQACTWVLLSLVFWKGKWVHTM